MAPTGARDDRTFTEEASEKWWILSGLDASMPVMADVNPECLFCAIVSGQAEASFVHADEISVAFMDLNPVTPGHVLTVPRRHAVGWKTSTRRRAPMCGDWGTRSAGP